VEQNVPRDSHKSLSINELRRCGGGFAISRSLSTSYDCFFIELWWSIGELNPCPRSLGYTRSLTSKPVCPVITFILSQMHTGIFLPVQWSHP